MSPQLERLKARFGENMVDQDWDVPAKVKPKPETKKSLIDDEH